MTIELPKMKRLNAEAFKNGVFRVMEYQEGIPRGSQEIEIVTKDKSFRVSISPTTGLSIAQVWADGEPIFMESPIPLHANPVYNPQINMIEGWLGSFYQGVVRCGLRWHGAPSVEIDPGKIEAIVAELYPLINHRQLGREKAIAEKFAELLKAYDTSTKKLPLHGRIGLTPARDVTVSHEGDGVVKVEGCVDEKMFFSDKLVLSTKIYIDTINKKINIEDEVSNVSKEVTTPVSLLYHTNWRLMGSGTTLHCAYSKAEARADPVSQGERNFLRFPRPTKGYQERCRGYDMLADDKGYVTVLLVSPDGQKGRYVKYNKEQLPQFYEWKQCSLDHYVVGLEPGIGEPLGRQTELEAKRLKILKPSKVLRASLEMGVLDKHGIADFAQNIDKIHRAYHAQRAAGGR